MANYRVPGQYSYDGILLQVPGFPPDIIDRVKTMQMEERDVCVVTYPQSGAVWVSELISLIDTYSRTKGKLAQKKDTNHRVWQLERVSTDTGVPDLDLLAADDTMPTRVMSTHLPAKIFKKQLQGRKGKFVVVMRNVKDNLVSYYHHYRAGASTGHFSGPWSKFFKLFQAKGLLYGDWLEFNLSWWDYRRQENIMIINYEDIVKVPHRAIQTISFFLDKPLTDSQLDAVLRHANFGNARQGESVQREQVGSAIKPKEEIGDWQAYFTPEQNEFTDKMYVQKAKAQGMTFDFIV